MLGKREHIRPRNKGVACPACGEKIYSDKQWEWHVRFFCSKPEKLVERNKPVVVINHQCGWCGNLTPHYCKEVPPNIAPHI